MCNFSSNNSIEVPLIFSGTFLCHLFGSAFENPKTQNGTKHHGSYEIIAICEGAKNIETNNGQIQQAKTEIVR